MTEARQGLQGKNNRKIIATLPQIYETRPSLGAQSGLRTVSTDIDLGQPKMNLTTAIAAVLTTTLLLGGCASKSKARSGTQAAAPNLGVNSFLWRASMETLDFMPLNQVDTFGGVIITDWYSNPSVPNERFKATVYILDTNLRADGLKVSVFKQAQTANGWQDASVDADTERQIENSILTRARELFIATVDAG